MDKLNLTFNEQVLAKGGVEQLSITAHLDGRPFIIIDALVAQVSSTLAGAIESLRHIITDRDIPAYEAVESLLAQDHEALCPEVSSILEGYAFNPVDTINTLGVIGNISILDTISEEAIHHVIRHVVSLLQDRCQFIVVDSIPKDEDLTNRFLPEEVSMIRCALYRLGMIPLSLHRGFMGMAPSQKRPPPGSVSRERLQAEVKTVLMNLLHPYAVSYFSEGSLVSPNPVVLSRMNLYASYTNPEGYTHLRQEAGVDTLDYESLTQHADSFLLPALD